MGSPQNNWNNPYYRSPYARQSYPSMEEGFVPLSFSSPYKAEQGSRQRTSGNFKQNWHSNYQKRRNYYQQNDYSYRPSLGDGEKNQSSDKFFHQRLSGAGSGDISDYMHPSIFEDPWKDLIERHKAIKASEDQSDRATATGEAASGHGPPSGSKDRGK